MDKVLIAEILPLKLNLEKGFYYLIPLHLKDSAAVGKRVTIPFKNKKKVGIILAIFCGSNLKELKEIEEVLDPIPILSKEVLSLTDWIAGYYLCSRGTIISHIIPEKVSPKKIINFFNELSSSNLILEEKKDFKCKVREIPELTNSGGSNDPSNAITSINTEQIVKPILFQYHGIKARDLYYSQMIKDTIQDDKQVLILIPDQYSSSGLKKKLMKKFGKSVAIFDQKASSAQKYFRFFQVQCNDIKIVIGTRSSIFLPFQKLGLIIVDQEESALYKEERMPRYHAREAALARGLLESFPVILGSPAPSLESYWQGLHNNYHLKTQEQQIFPEPKRLVQTFIVDLEKEKSFQRIISYQLQELIARCLKEKEGIALFLNRRGFAGYVYCGTCGQVMKCAHCHSLMSYHRVGNRGFLICTKCGNKIPENWNCPTCGEKSLKPLGFGTRYVEEIIHRMFPKAVVQCFDSDIAPNSKMQQQILQKYKRGEIDILIGTQLLINRLNYQQTALVGFILADHLLNIPDYHSAENAFQLMMRVYLQLEEEQKFKTLLIQTCQPKHHSLSALKELNYSLFYENEIVLRKELEYPPFTKIIKVEFSGTERESVKKEAQGFKKFIEQSDINLMAERNVFQIDDNLLKINEVGNNQVSFLFKIKKQNQNFEEFRKIFYPYILKYRKNKVKLIIDVEPTKMC